MIAIPTFADVAVKARPTAPLPWVTLSIDGVENVAWSARRSMRLETHRHRRSTRDCTRPWRLIRRAPVACRSGVFFWSLRAAQDASAWTPSRTGRCHSSSRAAEWPASKSLETSGRSSSKA